MSEDEKKAPTTLKRGMPAEQNNGLFGAEDRIMGLGVDGRFTAVVEFEVADIVHSEADGTKRPVVEFVHIEPVWSAEGAAIAAEVRENARAVRAGETQLDFGDLDVPVEGSTPAGAAGEGVELAPGKAAQWDDDEKGTGE